MTWLRTLRTRCRALFRQRQLDAEMDEEMRSHIELRTQANIESGMNPEEARCAALRQFGWTESIKEECRDQRGVRWLENLLQDLRYGARQLRRNPGFTAMAVLTLALGIGANTAIFSVLDAVVLRTLPVSNPEQLAVVAVRSPEWPDGPGTAFSYPMFAELRKRNEGFSELLAYSGVAVNLDFGEQTERITGQLVSGNFFSTLGIQAWLGRTFSDEDDRIPGAHAVAILSHGFWQRRFGGEPGVIGTTIRLNGWPFTIVGVSAPRFVGTEVGRAADVWVPAMMHGQLLPQAEVSPGYSIFSDPGSRWLNVMGRIKSGIQQEQAQASMDVLFHQINADQLERLPAEFPKEAIQQQLRARHIELLPGDKGLSQTRQQFVRPLAIVMATGTAVLLVACANLANLLLARTAARQREMAVRCALGAGRTRLLRQLLTESILLSVLGGALGVGFAFGGGRPLLAQFLPPDLSYIAAEFGLDWRVLGFASGVCFLTTLLFGLAPALQFSRPNLVASFQSDLVLPTLLSRRIPVRKLLVIAQVALSMILLMGTGLFVGTLRNLERLDLGLNTENVILLSLDAGQEARGDGRVEPFFDELVERVNDLPGIQMVGLASSGLVGGDGETDFFSVDGYQPAVGEKMTLRVGHVGPRCFAALGVPLQAGRDFEPWDGKDSPEVVIINETTARRYFGNQNPIGRRVGVGSRTPNREIVGVVADTRYPNPKLSAKGIAYLPFSQSHLGFSATISERTLVIRTTIDPQPFTAALRHEIKAVNSDATLFEVTTLRHRLEKSVSQERFIVELGGLFSGLSLVLAFLGLYGVLAYEVTRRIREFGIRTALGAPRGHLLWLILRESMLLVAIGAAIGFAGSLGMTRLVSSLLFGLTPSDPTVVGVAVLTLVGAAVVASWLPARRAARADPMVALRAE